MFFTMFILNDCIKYKVKIRLSINIVEPLQYVTTTNTRRTARLARALADTTSQ